MIKKKLINVTEKKEVVVDVLCNKCGKSCKDSMPLHPEHPSFHGIVGLEVHGGYGSPVIGDMCGIKFSLCEKCLIDFTKTFKLGVETKNDAHDFLPPKQAKIAEKRYEDWIRKDWIRGIKRKAKENKVKISQNLQKVPLDKMRKIYDSIK